MPYLDQDTAFRLAAQCAKQGAKVIGADFIIAKQSAAGTSPESDTGIPPAPAGRGPVYYPLYVRKSDPAGKTLPLETGTGALGWDIQVLAPGQLPVADCLYHSATESIPGSQTEGHVNLTPDSDGINRRLPLPGSGTRYSRVPCREICQTARCPLSRRFGEGY